MATILDLPPELINLIISNLKGPNELHKSGHRLNIFQGPQPSMFQALCPWSDQKTSGNQLLTSVGQDFGMAGRDVVRLWSVHPYIRECIEHSGCCEMVDASATHHGVIPSDTTTIPSLVRQVRFLQAIATVTDTDLSLTLKSRQRHHQIPPNNIQPRNLRPSPNARSSTFRPSGSIPKARSVDTRLFRNL